MAEGEQPNFLDNEDSSSVSTSDSTEEACSSKGPVLRKLGEAFAYIKRSVRKGDGLFMPGSLTVDGKLPSEQCVALHVHVGWEINKKQLVLGFAFFVKGFECIENGTLEYPEFLKAVSPKAMVHNYFLAAFESLLEGQVGSYALLDAIKIVTGGATPRRILCTGFCMSGGLATLATPWAALQYPTADVRCITFGAPRVGNNEFNTVFRWLAGLSYRAVYRRDPIPDRPKILRDVYKPVMGDLYLHDGAVEGKHRRAVRGGGEKENMADHQPGKYNSSLVQSNTQVAALPKSASGLVGLVDPKVADKCKGFEAFKRCNSNSTCEATKDFRSLLRKLTSGGKNSNKSLDSVSSNDANRGTDTPSTMPRAASLETAAASNGINRQDSNNSNGAGSNSWNKRAGNFFIRILSRSNKEDEDNVWNQSATTPRTGDKPGAMFKKEEMWEYAQCGGVVESPKAHSMPKAPEQNKEHESNACGLGAFADMFEQMDEQPKAVPQESSRLDPLQEGMQSDACGMAAFGQFLEAMPVESPSDSPKAQDADTADRKLSRSTTDPAVRAEEQPRTGSGVDEYLANAINLVDGLAPEGDDVQPGRRAQAAGPDRQMSSIEMHDLGVLEFDVTKLNELAKIVLAGKIRHAAMCATAAYYDTPGFQEQTGIRTSRLLDDQVADTQVHVGWLESGTAVLSFRGTASRQDAAQDLKFVRQQIEFLPDQFPGAKAHTGFLQQFAAVTNPNEPDLHIGKTLLELSGGRSPTRVLCCGHSLGGALATLAAAWAAIQYPDADVRCITFGSPRVGNNKFKRAFQSLVGTSYRIVYGGDPVPSMPPSFRYTHVNNVMFFHRGEASLKDRPWHFTWRPNVYDHFMNRYQGVIHRNIPGMEGTAQHDSGDEDPSPSFVDVMKYGCMPITVF